MADPKKLVSLSGLSHYNDLIQTWAQGKIDEAEAKSLHTGAVVGDKVYFFTEEVVPKTGSDVDTSKAKFSFDISSSDIVELKAILAGYDNEHTVATAVADAKKAGTDAAADVVALNNSLVAVAKSGKASDVTIEDATEKITATTVEGALSEIVGKADANASAIATLNGSGAGSVSKAITDAIEALDGTVTGEGNFVKTISETDGKITATLGGIAVADVPTLTLEKISDAGTAAAKDVATTAIVENSEDANLVTAAQVAKFVKDEVADLEGAMHFVGVITRNEGETDVQAIERVVTSPDSGDVVVMSDNGKEYIFVDPDPETAGDEVWREIGDEGLYVTKSTTIAGVDLQDNITKAELLTALNVADGAQVNVLEGVQVNGTDLTITDKKVNVTVATGSANGTVAVNGADVAVKGLGSAAYTDATAYDAAGVAAGLVGTLPEGKTVMGIIGTVPEKVGETTTDTVIAYVNAKAAAVEASFVEVTNAEIDALFADEE